MGPPFGFTFCELTFEEAQILDHTCGYLFLFFCLGGIECL